ncbi:MAG: biotin--[acetyl-CoA-carboxylase] ligase [Roseburia sp.]|nr:biotin--[acetyl-CoA-carboxylase] ligase [Roseburia sp.]
MKIDERVLRKQTGLKVSVFDECDSTFDEIGDLDAIIALSQKNGKGRGDHQFFSPRGGIYIVMRVNGLHIDAHTLAPRVGLAAHDAIKTVLGIDTRLKWINDIMLNGKKIAGILCKCPRRGEYLIGIGVNYATNEAELLAAGLQGAGALCAPSEKATEFTAQLLKRIRRAAIEDFDAARYNALCVTVGKTVSFMHNGISVRGYAEAVENDGTLLVRIGTATVAVDAGEVSVVREVTE